MPSLTFKRFSVGILQLRVATALCLAGCGGFPTTEPPRIEEASAVGRIGVDPATVLPLATPSASSREMLAVLRAPVATDRIAPVVRRLFEAFHLRNLAGLELDFEESVVDLLTSKDQTRPQFFAVLAERLKNSSFDQLDPDGTYRPKDIEYFSRDELGGVGKIPRPAVMVESDVLVRIPISNRRVGSDLLFGEDIKLLLRRNGSRYRIRGYGENIPR